MNPFANLLSFSPTKARAESMETKRSASSLTHYLGLPPAIWTNKDYRSYVDEGYKRNVVAFMAISKLAAAMASFEWVNQNGDTDSPLLRLLKRPNPWQTGREWWTAKTIFMLLNGNNFDELVELNNGEYELYTLRPDRMKVQMSSQGTPKNYVYSAAFSRGATWPIDVNTGESMILHSRVFDPLTDEVGTPPIKAAAYAIDQHNEAMKWMQALLQNSAKPSGALILKGDQALTEPQWEKLKAEVETSYSGAANAGRPMLLEGGMDWKSMGLSPDDMKLIDTKDSAARDISLAFGVPPLLLNIPGDNTYSNYREARLGFYEDTVIPMALYVAEELNNWLEPRFNETIKPNLDKVEAISDKRRDMWKMVDTSDELTVNEARELKGFAPLPAPLGNMLMADLRSTRRMQQLGQEDDDAQTQETEAEKEKRLAYG